MMLFEWKIRQFQWKKLEWMVSSQHNLQKYLFNTSIRLPMLPGLVWKSSPHIQPPKVETGPADLKDLTPFHGGSSGTVKLICQVFFGEFQV